jgi:eukaryotic-like serine/threonine-protein kinase
VSLSPGVRVGSYEITALIGEGGMGKVWRAHHIALNRDDALKVLPDAFASDPDRLARFRREAQVLASLNHPNIAHVYGLEQADGVQALVMELVEGETLADRIARGATPIEEALPIAKQIAEALEAAHEQGIIHRDLKPANVKVRPDGTVKVLDFGLAKLAESPAAVATSAALSISPTITSPAMVSGVGVLLGTAAYMSPEQARGKAVDRRSDIWAFGCVLYEMLSDRRAFRGEDVTETLAAVMLKEPEWNALPAKTPARLRELLGRCLIKDPRNRVQAIGDARIAIDEVQSGGGIDRDVTQTPARRISKAWVGIVTILLLTTFVFAALWVVSINRPVPPAPPEIRVEVTTPSTDDPLSFAVSPDGRRLVFSASNEGKSQLWVRPLDSVAARPLAGTDGARYPFWSPDSASVGFFADSKLKRIDIVGGAPQALANAVAGFGGAWNRDGTILFAPTGANPLSRVPAAGGEPVVVTRLDTGQASHRFPQFLPDGRHFTYFVQGGSSQGVYVGSLDGVAPKRLANADAPAVVSPSGFLLFVRQTTLFAQAFDFQKQELSGNPFPVAEQAVFDISIAPGFSASTGIVAYRTGSISRARQLAWLDRSGKSVGTIGAPDSADMTNVELSPDGKRIAVWRVVNGNADVWLIDAARGVPTRFTFDAATDSYPVWSSDGNRVVFASTRKGPFNLYLKLSSGAGADELLLESDQGKVPTDWSVDGRFLLFRSNDPQTGFDLWVLPLSGDKKPIPFLKTPFVERDGQFSPDGKWIAYQSNESGRFEIYVQPFPGPGGKFQISATGGAQPRWDKNGREVFYVSLDGRMMAAPVKLSPDGQSLETGTPAALFPVRIAGGPLPGSFKQQYAVSSDGQRFLVNLAADEGVSSPITLILNWKPRP